MIEVENLGIAFDARTVVDGVSFTLAPGRTLGIVGESGSGKSMTALALMGLVPEPGRISQGRIVFNGTEITKASEDEMRALRGRRIAMIFQDPSSALNPVFSVGNQIAEAYRLHHDASRAQARTRAIAAMRDVGIPDAAVRADSYPHQLSGGMRQRCMIAMALINEPDLLIADEPTTALDVTVQAQILALMRDLQQRRGIAMLFISHNLAVVSEMADDIVVMQHGCIVERASARDLFAAPRHAYTRRLIDALTLPGNGAPASDRPALIEVSDLTKRFAVKSPSILGGILRRRIGEVKALNGVSFDIKRGETFAIVGESGSGKSTLAKTLLGLHRADDGTIRLDGTPVPAAIDRRAKELRRRLQMVFQDPYASLNPRLTAAQSIGEPLAIHGIGGNAERQTRIAEAARAVGIDPADLAKYPHEFSGGERQRIAIARAIIAEPALILADEPLSSLDVSIQTQVIALLQGLKERLGLTYLFISHDLSVVAHLADRVAVMYAGRIVEQAPTESLFAFPRHPYTKALLDSAPRLGWARSGKSVARGEPPSTIHPPPGCPFHPRCPKSQEICANTRPTLVRMPAAGMHHQVACHFPASEQA
jgi:peptide/nickel transport system ATP-binding protein